MNVIGFDLVEDLGRSRGIKLMGGYVGGWWVGVYVFGEVVVEWGERM